MNAAVHTVRRNRRCLNCAPNVRIVCMVIPTATMTLSTVVADSVTGMVRLQVMLNLIACLLSKSFVLFGYVTIRLGRAGWNTPCAIRLCCDDQTLKRV